MICKISWSNFANNQLLKIHDYYFEKISPELAKKIILNIAVKVKSLEKNQFIGQTENLLNDRKNEYRYLVYSNYKIIYSIDNKRKIVKIMDVFDTRQNPIKIKRKK